MGLAWSRAGFRLMVCLLIGGFLLVGTALLVGSQMPQQTLAYTSNLDGKIFLLDIGSGVTWTLSDSARNWALEWSPDGGQLAFQPQEGDRMKIEVVDSDASHRHRLTDEAVMFERDPHWSPDGRQ